MTSLLPSILSHIVEVKKEEIRELKRNQKADIDRQKISSIRDFRGALLSAEGTSIIAEIKFASPSAGRISKKINPLAIGRIYEKAGAAAISFITDIKFFKGDPGQLPLLKKTLHLPILRKDFIIDKAQVIESSLLGADAVLLIARLLSAAKLKEFLSICSELGMDALVETHNERDIDKAIECGAKIIGINNRDLETFEVKKSTTLRLASLIPDGIVVVSESGIENSDDIELLMKHSIDAALVGTSLMRSQNIEQKLAKLVTAGNKKGTKRKR